MDISDDDFDDLLLFRHLIPRLLPNRDPLRLIFEQQNIEFDVNDDSSSSEENFTEIKTSSLANPPCEILRTFHKSAPFGDSTPLIFPDNCGRNHIYYERYTFLIMTSNAERLMLHKVGLVSFAKPIKLCSGSTSDQRKTLRENDDKSRANIWKHIQRREMGLDTKGNLSTGFSEPEKSTVFSKYLPNKVTEVIEHRAKVFSGHYSQDGSVFMSATQDFHIKLYETGRGKLREFQDVVALNVAWSIVDTAYSHDQRHLIYSSWSSNLYLCNIAGGSEKGQVALDMRPEGNSFCAFSVKFSQDDREILTGSNEGSLYIYDRGCEKRTSRISGHSDDVNAVCFCDNTSQLLFSASDDGLCKVWDRRTLSEQSPEPVGVFAGHVCGLGGIDSKGDGRYLITSSKDQTIKLWDMRRFTDAEGIREGVMATAKNQHWDYRWEGVPKRFQRSTKLKGDVSVETYRGHSFLRCLIRARFSPVETTGQRYVYTGSADGCVYIYDLHSGKIASKLHGHSDVVRDVSWHPNKPFIRSSSWDQTVKCWQYSRDKEETERSDKEIAEDKRERQTPKPCPRLFSQGHFF